MKPTRNGWLHLFSKPDMRLSNIPLAFFYFTVLLGCAPEKDPEYFITSGKLKFRITKDLYTQLEKTSDTVLVPCQPSEYLQSDTGFITDFSVTSFAQTSIIENGLTGREYLFTGKNEQTGIIKQLTVRTYDSIPNLITTRVRYINHSGRELIIRSWINNGYQLASNEDTPPFWAFQGSSTAERADWIKPVRQGYYQQNYMGMNNSDYGGGIPVTDVWRKDIGLAVGHCELSPQLISLPTQMKPYEHHVSIGVQEDFPYPYYFAPGDTINTLETFTLIHEGDYYNALKTYSRLMQAKGILLPVAEPAAFEPIWCAWGYERDFTLDEVIGTLPKVKALGIKWAVLDDGFQQAEGDWHTNKSKFPGGDNQMKALVHEIHRQGLKAKLWWAPLAADPTSQLLATHPDMRLYLEDGAPQYITWWDAYYLSPTHPQTLTHTRETIELFIKEWDFDGLKMDGQHMNAVAPDHNPGSHLESPEQAPERLPDFFKLIYDETLALKPHAVVENCPCGTCMSFFNMPYMNQAVSSDPMSSWQIRHKGKTYKALIPQTAYYGDHVELSDGARDFASSFGIGAVLGTKFTWPHDHPDASGSFVLTPEKEVEWRKWFGLYNTKMLSREKYRGELYDIGYDLPETHVVQKGDTLHYAFYASHWTGPVEFRGLSAGQYEVKDYFHQEVLGELDSSHPVLDLAFSDFLLVEVYKK